MGNAAHSGISIGDLGPREDWSALETRLIESCATGEFAFLPGKHGCPEDESDPERRVRATFIEYLMSGGCAEGARPSRKGVQLGCAWIDGALDLQGLRTELDLSLHQCLFASSATLQDAELGGLYLTGSHCNDALDLQRLKTLRNVHLGASRQFDGKPDPDAPFRAAQSVDLGGARIGGQLACVGGRFEAPEGDALNCNAVEIGANVFLAEGFKARGRVNFRGAKVGGQLACVGGRFEAVEGDALSCDAAEIGADVFLRDGFEARGLVNFRRAEISGHLLLTGSGEERPCLGDGIDLQGAQVGAGLFLKGLTGDRKKIYLTEARVGSLRDDWAFWDGAGRVKLDGFIYDRVEGSMSVKRRLDWLALTSAGMEREVEIGPKFDPQPHVHLAKVLREQGNRDGAARVLVDREVRQRKADRERIWARNTSPQGMLAWVLMLWMGLRDGLFGVVFGYGHRPVRALLAALVLIFAASVLNGVAYMRGEFAPNDPVILTSPDWMDAVKEAGPEGVPLPLWIKKAEAAQDYETFNAALYGLDLVLPFDTLGQEEAWRASADRGTWGWWAFYSRWFFQISGIVIAAVGAAVLTGLVGRRD